MQRTPCQETLAPRARLTTEMAVFCRLCLSNSRLIKQWSYHVVRVRTGQHDR
jgi:hypothetical protein